MTLLPYLLHGTTLGLAWFLLVNAIVTGGVALVAARLSSDTRTPGFWLGLRLLPSVLSIAFVAALFLPSYWRYEPRELVEGFDVTLTALAVLALSVIAAAAVRAASAWRRAARRTDLWMRASRPLAVDGIDLPVFAVDADVPVMALAGVLRPRLLITRPVLAALTGEELRAGIAHELGHWRAYDNLKRLVMQAAPDLLPATASARAIERRWAAASEHVADRAAGDTGAERCALASALVKVARMTPPASSIAMPISTLVDGGDITSRVRRLLDDAPVARAGRSMRWISFVLAAAALAAAYAPLLRLVHGVTELLVSTVP
jgi:Zn-dependent protease with chaperone function